MNTSLLSSFSIVNTTTSIFSMSTEVPGPGPDRPNLGDIISARRIELGFSQEQVAERVNMSQEWVTKVERGRIKRPRIPSLIAIADTLNLNADDLVVAAGYVRSSSSAAELVENARREMEAEAQRLSPHLRASFFKVQELSPERQERVASLIDIFWEEDQAELQQMKRDRERRLEEGLNS